MRIVVTGADGFLGWHTRVRLLALTDHEVVPVGRADRGRLPELVGSADAVLHLAGINRGDAGTVEQGNAELASVLADAVGRAAGRPGIVYADSVQVGNGSPYGNGKGRGRRDPGCRGGVAGAGILRRDPSQSVR